MRLSQCALLLALLACVACLGGAVDIHSNRQKPITTGDFLRAMEWVPGSDDVSFEDDRRPHILSKYAGVRPPSRVFGVQFPTKTPEKSGNGLVDQFESVEEFESARLGAKLVSAYEQENDPAFSTMPEVLRSYRRFLHEHPKFVQNMRRFFRHMDKNEDGQLDDGELNDAVNVGLLSQLGARCLRSWDVNYSRRVSWKEFELGPLFMTILEAHEKILHAFLYNVPDNQSLVARLYRAVLGSYVMGHPAATGLLEEEVRVTGKRVSAGVEAQAQAQTEATAETTATVQSQLQARLEAQAQAEAEIAEKARASTMTSAQLQAEQAADAMAFQELGLDRRARGKRGIFRKVGKFIRRIFGRKKKPEPKPKPKAEVPKPKAEAKPKADGKPDLRYKSAHGVPTFENEQCVMCQYVVQRVQHEMNSKVVDDHVTGPFATRPYPGSDTMEDGGTRTFQSMTGQMPGTARREARMVSERGARSPTRMFKEMIEVMMQKVCGNHAPFLFRPHCDAIWKQREDMAYGMFRRMNSGPICMQVKMCDQSTYFYSELGGIHYPEMSNKFNNNRGLCGMLGGPKARAYDGLDTSVCAKAAGKPKTLDEKAEGAVDSASNWLENMFRFSQMRGGQFGTQGAMEAARSAERGMPAPGQEMPMERNPGQPHLFELPAHPMPAARAQPPVSENDHVDMS